MSPARAAIVIAVVGVVAVAAVTAVARADPPAPAAVTPQPYRSDLIIADTASGLTVFVMTPLAIREDRRGCPTGETCADNEIWTLVMAGVAGYLVSGPVIHTRARHHGRAVASALLRIGLPLAAGLGADAAGARSDRAWIAAGGGMVAAMMIDWWALADRTYEPAPAAAGLYLAPTAAGGVIAGYAARWR